MLCVYVQLICSSFPSTSTNKFMQIKIYFPISRPEKPLL